MCSVTFASRGLPTVFSARASSRALFTSSRRRRRFAQRSSASGLSLSAASGRGMSFSMTWRASSLSECGMSCQTSFEVKASSGASRRIIASRIM